jgi:hypothetical protein
MHCGMCYPLQTKWEAIQKSLILLARYCKNYHFLRGTKIISHFDASNNIFVDCNPIKGRNKDLHLLKQR